ncbi:hypothetical protein Dimus_027317, partial [Dionaea muscipula]
MIDEFMNLATPGESFTYYNRAHAIGKSIAQNARFVNSSPVSVLMIPTPGMSQDRQDVDFSEDLAN